MTLPLDGTVYVLSNPRCSTSRKFIASLRERRVPFVERRYLDDPLDRAELLDLAERLEGPLSGAIRRKEPAYAEAGLSPESTEAELVEAVLAHPVLLERPILIHGPRARVARPPEAALELLDALR